MSNQGVMSNPQAFLSRFPTFFILLFKKAKFRGNSRTKNSFGMVFDRRHDLFITSSYFFVNFMKLFISLRRWKKLLITANVSSVNAVAIK